MASAPSPSRPLTTRSARKRPSEVRPVFLLLFLFMLFWLLMNFPQVIVYTYESSDRGMALVEVPQRGLTYDKVLIAFEAYRRRSGQPDLRLFRTSNPPWGNPWLLKDNLYHPRWDLPYQPPSERPQVNFWIDLLPTSAWPASQ